MGAGRGTRSSYQEAEIAESSVQDTSFVEAFHTLEVETKRPPTKEREKKGHFSSENFMNKCKKKWLLKRMWYNVGGKAMYVDEKVSALALLLRKKPKKKKS